MFFDLNERLCERYHALTPFAVRRESFAEVILLVNRINAKETRNNGAKCKKGETIRYDKRGNMHIRRKATNDNWY